MNRHNKFYAELEDLMDDDYYDEDEYYEEEEGEEDYDEGEEATESQPAKSAPRPNPHISICPEVDEDFDVLDAVLPAMHETWKATAPTELPLTEAEAVQALRDNNYDTDAAAAALQVAHSERKKTQQVRGGRVLKVAGAKAEGPAKSGDDAELSGLSNGNDEASAGLTTMERAAKALKNRRKDVELVVPDANKLDCTFVIAGHVDAGKSTTLGHLLLLLGKVSLSDVEKNEKAGRGTNKESFKYAWLLDQSEEERRRGVTIDSGSFCFETEHRRVHILDAPGHKDFVLSMISSATQADAALLVVTASTTEFEKGLQHGTREHLMILKTLGVGCIIVAVNKMDSVGYSKERFDYVVSEVKQLFRQIHVKEEVLMGFCPISGMSGTNIVTRDAEAIPWYSGPSLVGLVDACSLESRLLDGPLRVSLQDVQGSTLYARVESGRLARGDTLTFVPADVKVFVKSVGKPTVGGVVPVALAGDTVEIGTNSPLVGLYPGCVGCLPAQAIVPVTDFEVHAQTFPTLQKAVLPGATFMMVAHALTVRVKVVALVAKMDARTGEWTKGMVKCLPPSTQALVVLRAESRVALDPAQECRALGRFVLQQDGETVAGGLVRRLVS